MRLPERILRLVASIGLQMVMGEKTAEEVIEVCAEACRSLNAWLRKPSDDPDSPSRELVVREVIQANPEPTPKDVEIDLDFFLTEVQELPENSVKDVTELLGEVLPRRRATYVLWLGPEIVGGESGRYCHFNWEITADGEGYNIRDYISGTMFHPCAKPRRDAGWEHQSLDLNALEIWRAAEDRIPSHTKQGLGFHTKYRDKWKEKLTQLTGLHWRMAGL